MKQRSLVNSKPWVFIPPESVPDDDDYLAEQQLKQEMARGRPRKQVSEPSESQDVKDVVHFVNESAVKGTEKEPAAAKSTGKRKRGESAGNVIEETSRKRRVAGRPDNVTDPRSGREAMPAKLPRPSQPPRHMIQTYPAVEQKINDVYSDISHPTEPLKNTAVVVQNPNGTSRQNGAVDSAKRAKNTALATETSVPAEGHSSAVLNGRANVTAKSGRGRSKTKTTSKSARSKTNPSRKDVATLERADANEEQSIAGSEELLGDVDMTESFHLETDDDDENEQRSFDLLGYEVDWEKILKAAQSVCGSRLPKNKMPILQTETIKALISKVIAARTLYQNSSYDKPMDDVHEVLVAIEERVKHDSISEAKAFNKKSQMIRDIYACAIPALVLLLESAISFHALHPNGLRRYEALQDIVRVQEVIICLSMKAKMWRASPNSDRPIIKPTKGTILPYTRGMKKVFETELVKQKRKWKMRQNASKTAKSDQDLVEYSHEQRELSTTETNKRVARGFALIQREREILRGSRKLIGCVSPQLSQDNDVTYHSTRWNAEEEKELMRQLQFGYTRDQTGRCFEHQLYCHSSLTTLIAEMRYLTILNTRLLQNKLPERIREKALELKPFLKEVYGARDWIESIL